MRFSYPCLVVVVFLGALGAFAQEIKPAPRNPVIRAATPNFVQGQLAAESIKVALLGDSLSVPFHYTDTKSAPDMVQNHRAGGWFLDITPDNQLKSFYEMLTQDAKVPTSAMNVSIAGSWIKRPNFFVPSLLLGMDTMDRQVSRVLMEPEFPNLILVWQGHNDADWRYAANGLRIPDAKLADFRKDLQQQVTRNLAEQLNRIISRAEQARYPVTIVVFGLLDVRSAIETRRKVIQEKLAHPEKYEFLPNSKAGFPSVDPDLAGPTTEMVDGLLTQWKSMVEGLNDRIRGDREKTQILYSDALNRVKITLDRVSPEDGLHFKIPEGHQAAADAVYAEFQRLGILNYLHPKQK
jgi:hypothetical protein